MTRAEFIGRLNKALSPLEEKERTDIIMDYAEHFDAGLNSGKTQEEIAEKLGSPEELASTYLEEHGTAGAGTQYTPSAYTSPVYPSSSGQKSAAVYNQPVYPESGGAGALDSLPRWIITLTMVLITVFCTIPAGCVILGLVVTIWGVSVSLIASAIILCGGVGQLSGAALAGMLCIIAGLLGLSFSAGVLATVVLRKTVNGFKWLYAGIASLLTTGKWKNQSYNEGEERA